MLKQCSAGVVIYRLDEEFNRTYLLLQYPKGPWDFAKGKLKDGEAWRHCAIREVSEETGIEVKLYKNFEHSYTYKFNDSQGNRIEKTVVFFLAQVPYDSQIKLSEEHIDFLWLSYQQARMQLPFDNIKYLLDQVEQFLDVSSV